MFTCKWQLVHPPSETEGKLSSTDLYKLIKKWNRFPSRKWNKKLGRFESTNGDYRLWDLKPSIYDCKTYVTDKTEPLPSCTDIPRGFDFFEYDLNDNNLLIAACSEMNYLFDELKSCNSKINNDIVRVSRKNGRSFWPDFDSYMIQSQQFKDHFELNGCFLPLNTAFMTQWMQDHGFDNALKLFTHHYDRVIKSIYDSQNTKNDVYTAWKSVDHADGWPQDITTCLKPQHAELQLPMIGRFQLSRSSFACLPVGQAFIMNVEFCAIKPWRPAVL